MRDKGFTVNKVAGADNLADIMAKIVDGVTLQKHLSNMDCRAEGGRAASASELIQQSLDVLHIPHGDYRYDEKHFDA